MAIPHWGCESKVSKGMEPFPVSFVTLGGFLPLPEGWFPPERKVARSSEPYGCHWPVPEGLVHFSASLTGP